MGPGSRRSPAVTDRPTDRRQTRRPAGTGSSGRSSPRSTDSAGQPSSIARSLSANVESSRGQPEVTIQLARLLDGSVGTIRARWTDLPRVGSGPEPLGVMVSPAAWLSPEVPRRADAGKITDQHRRRAFAAFGGQLAVGWIILEPADPRPGNPRAFAPSRRAATESRPGWRTAGPAQKFGAQEPGASGLTGGCIARSAVPVERLAEERSRMRPITDRMPDIDRHR